MSFPGSREPFILDEALLSRLERASPEEALELLQIGLEDLPELYQFAEASGHLKWAGMVLETLFSHWPQEVELYAIMHRLDLWTDFPHEAAIIYDNAIRYLRKQPGANPHDVVVAVLRGMAAADDRVALASDRIFQRFAVHDRVASSPPLAAEDVEQRSSGRKR